MNRKALMIALPAMLVLLGGGMASAGETVEESGAIACVNDKWDEKEVAKGHKQVVYAGRCGKDP